RRRDLVCEHLWRPGPRPGHRVDEFEIAGRVESADERLQGVDDHTVELLGSGDERVGQGAVLDVDHDVVDRDPVEPVDHVEAHDVRSGATEGYGEVTETA